MPPRGSVKDPDTGTFHPGDSPNMQEIIASQEAAKNPPIDPDQTLIDNYMATEQSDSSGQVPTWLALLLRQMKEDTNTHLAVIQEWSDAQLAALQVQNGNLIAALSPRMLSTLQVQPAATVNVDNANLMLTKQLKASDIGSFTLLILANASL